jgi:hypothetical protein
MERRKITVPRSTLVLTLAGMTVIGIVFYAGYATGKYRIVIRELNVSIPVNVHLYQTIKQGDRDKAATLISMILMGKLDRYDSLTNDLLFRLAGGGKLLDSARFQESITEARKIVAEEKTNLVTVVAPVRKKK